MAQHLLQITGSDRYEYLTYTVTDRPQPTALQIGVREKTYGPPFLMVGLDLNNIDSTNFAVNLSGRVLQYGLLGVGSETRLDFVLGTTQHVGAEMVKPIGSTPMFVAPVCISIAAAGTSSWTTCSWPSTAKTVRPGSTSAAISDAMPRCGWANDITDFKGRRRIGSPELPEVDGSERFAHLDFFLDTQTSPLVPTRGWRVRSFLRQFFAAPTASGHSRVSLSTARSRSPAGEVRTSWFRRARSRDDRLFLIGEGGSSFGADPLVNDFALGGPLRLGSFNNDQLRGDNYLLFGGGYLRGIGRMPDVLGGSVFLGAWVEAGSAFNDWDEKDWKSDITGGFILETLLGPVFLGGSVGFQGGGRFYISLGPFFQ